MMTICMKRASRQSKQSNRYGDLPWSGSLGRNNKKNKMGTYDTWKDAAGA